VAIEHFIISVFYDKYYWLPDYRQSAKRQHLVVDTCRRIY